MRVLIVLAAVLTATPALAFTARDMREQEVRLADSPQRIVSLVPSATEAIFAVGGQARLVGVTDFCDWPPAARQKPRVGGMITPSLESIVGLRPDLVVATDEGNSESTFDGLARLGIPLYVVRAHRLRDAFGLIARMGELTGQRDAVRPLLDGLRARVQRVVDAVASLPRRRVLYVLWPDPIIVPGREGIVTELIELAGGESLTAAMAGGYPRLSLEAVVAYQPDVILLARHGGDQTATLRAEWDRLGAVPALHAGRVHAVDGTLLHRYGPRVVDGLEMLARVIHPEARF
jgi:iron complex transport system substrate-binding protein